MSGPHSGDSSSAVAYEDKHVHQVYEQIASHFSETRYKPWPVVHRFLTNLAPGSIGLDIGCGNGKYLSVNKDVFIIASDRSRSLIDIVDAQRQPANTTASTNPHSAIVADTLHLPHPSQTFDFAISIAVIHHLSSRSRRIDALREILRCLRLKAGRSTSDHHDTRQTTRKPGRATGQALIFVWALEQKGSRRGWDRGNAQDVLVPWVLKGDQPHRTHPPAKPNDNESEQDSQTTQRQGQSTPPPQQQQQGKTFQRYYHLYAEGELQSEVAEAGGVVVEDGYDRDNWWVVIKPG